MASALDDVFEHTADDAETKRLVLEIVVRKNGREPHTVTLTCTRVRAPSAPATSRERTTTIVDDSLNILKPNAPSGRPCAVTTRAACSPIHATAKTMRPHTTATR